MIYHAKCKSPVYVDLTEGVKILSCIGIGPKGMTTGMLEISLIKKSIPAQFFCNECGSQVENTDIIILCGVCGKEVPFLEAWSSEETGGLYCEKDVKEKFESSCKQVKDIASTVKVKG
jgi:hypothetical protein